MFKFLLKHTHTAQNYNLNRLNHTSYLQTIGTVLVLYTKQSYSWLFQRFYSKFYLFFFLSIAEMFGAAIKNPDQKKKKKKNANKNVDCKHARKVLF